MKISDIEKAQELINEIREVSNRIRGIKDFFDDSSENGLVVAGEISYFNSFYLTKEETENIILRLENNRLALIEKLQKLGVEMD